MSPENLLEATSRHPSPGRSDSLLLPGLEETGPAFLGTQGYSRFRISEPPPFYVGPSWPEPSTSLTLALSSTTRVVREGCIVTQTHHGLQSFQRVMAGGSHQSRNSIIVPIQHTSSMTRDRLNTTGQIGVG